jgi:transcription elongation factor GreA
MPSTHKHNPTDSDLSLGQTTTRFLATIPPESSARVQQEVFKFIRWYGDNKKVSSLTGQEVANYSEQLNTSSAQSADHLTTVKQFLAYAYKQGFSHTNLAPHIRIKKIASKKRLAPSTARAEEPVMLTSQGYEELKNKLSELKEERPKMAEELRKAAADKDFRENAPLAAARERQGHIEGQIRELEETVKRAKVVKTVKESVLRVTLGDLVAISYVETGEKINYTLVSAREANIKQGKISMVSPMGQSLFNKEIGDDFEVNAPSGVLKYKIIEINRT